MAEGITKCEKQHKSVYRSHQLLFSKTQTSHHTQVMHAYACRYNIV